MTVGRTDLQALNRKRRVNWDLCLVMGILKLALVEENTGDDFFWIGGSFFWRNRPTGAQATPLLRILDNPYLDTHTHIR